MLRAHKVDLLPVLNIESPARFILQFLIEYDLRVSYPAYTTVVSHVKASTYQISVTQLLSWSRRLSNWCCEKATRRHALSFKIAHFSNLARIGLTGLNSSGWRAGARFERAPSPWCANLCASVSPYPVVFSEERQYPLLYNY